MTSLKEYTMGDFWNRIMSAVAMAIVVAVTPSAIVGPLFQALATHGAFWSALNTACNMATYAVPVLCGALAAGQFNFTMIERASVALATLLGSGAVNYSAKGGGTFTLVGMGDLINTIIVTALAVFAIFLIRDYVGSFAIIWDPIVATCIVGGIGMFIYPYVHLVSTTVGGILNSFTNLQPVLMCTLLGMAFAVIIATPLSTVGLAYAFGITGIAGGASSVGVSACFLAVAYACSKVNGKGVVVAMVFGSVKMMLANFLKHPQMLIPLAITGALTGFTDSFIQVKNVAADAGFGIPVGPINAYTLMSGSVGTKLLTIALIYFILPTIYGILAYYLCTHVFHFIKDEYWKVDLDK